MFSSAGHQRVDVDTRLEKSELTIRVKTSSADMIAVGDASKGVRGTRRDLRRRVSEDLEVGSLREDE